MELNVSFVSYLSDLPIHFNSAVPTSIPTLTLHSWPHQSHLSCGLWLHPLPSLFLGVCLQHSHQAPAPWEGFQGCPQSVLHLPLTSWTLLTLAPFSRLWPSPHWPSCMLSIPRLPQSYLFLQGQLPSHPLLEVFETTAALSALNFKYQSPQPLVVFRKAHSLSLAKLFLLLEKLRPIIWLSIMVSSAFLHPK